MKIYEVTYKTNNGELQGYFIKTKKGYVKINIQEESLYHLKIIKEEEVICNPFTLKMEKDK